MLYVHTEENWAKYAATSAYNHFINKNKLNFIVFFYYYENKYINCKYYTFYKSHYLVPHPTVSYYFRHLDTCEFNFKKNKMTNKKEDKSTWAIGGGILIGVGVGFFYLQTSPLAFVGSILIGLGIGLMTTAILSGRKS